MSKFLHHKLNECQILDSYDLENTACFNSRPNTDECNRNMLVSLHQ